MPQNFLDIAVTPSVHAAQVAMGSDGLWAKARGRQASDKLSADEVAFVAERDSFYIATVSETGWPYIQHRGGPRGFLKVVDEQTLAFGDYRGNKQYISVGNAAEDNRTCLFLMDYVHRARLKIYARVEVLALDAEPALRELVAVPKYKAKLERIMRFRVEAFDWNCPQHITPRFTEQEVADALRPLHKHVEELETENARLRRQIAELSHR